jgi:DNA-binding transcriptional regulator YhcF (GntR family)
MSQLSITERIRQEKEYRKIQETFTCLSNEVLDNESLNANAKMVYWLITSYQYRKDKQLSIRYISKHLKISANTVAKSIKSLVDFGYIEEVVKGTAQNNNGTIYSCKKIHSSKKEPVSKTDTAFKEPVSKNDTACIKNCDNLKELKEKEKRKSKSKTRAKTNQSSDSPSKNRLFYINFLLGKGFRKEEILKAEDYATNKLGKGFAMSWLATGDSMQSVLIDFAKQREIQNEREKQQRRKEYTSEDNKNPFVSAEKLSEWARELLAGQEA